MVDELSTLNDAGSSGDEQYSDDAVGRKNIGNVNLDVGNGGPLNEDSDLEIDINENDGQMVGDSGSEKGEAM